MWKLKKKDSFADVKKKYEWIISELEKQELFYQAHETGSRGYHISLIYNRNLSSREKLEIIKRFNCDTQKANKRVMIALENCPHYKTGKPKKLIKENKGINSGIIIPEDTALREEVLLKLASKQAFSRNEATELIVKAILKERKIYSTRDDEKSEMWIYNEGIYIPQAKTFIKEFVRSILGFAYTGHLGNEIIMKIETDTYIDTKEFFGNNNIDEIAVENGILNIFTKKIRHFSDKDIFFNKIPVVYNSESKCPNISKHLATVLKHEEDIPVIEELFGFLLLKEYRFEKAFMFSGEGRNGKGKTLELMKRFLGAENCVNIPLQDFETDTYAIGHLFGKLANLSGDIDKKALVKTGVFKTLTGRDIVSGNRKFLSRLDFQNYAKQIFCANELPITYDKKISFWDRWVLLEFPYIFISEKEYDKVPKEEKSNYKLADPEIVDKIATENELGGLLNIALDGLKRLVKQKDFSYNKSNAEVEDLWTRKSDSFSAFLKDCVEEDWEGKITKQELRKAYSGYCKMHKTTMMSDKLIKGILTATFPVGEERDQGSGKQVTYWSGVIFKRSMESIDSNGFSTLIGISKSPLGKNTITTLTSFTSNKGNKEQETIDFTKSGVKEELEK